MKRGFQTDETIVTVKNIITDHIKNLENRFIYHLVVTYKRRADVTYSQEDVNSFFNAFYLDGLLPYLVANRQPRSDTLPICYAFLDDHTTESLRSDNTIRYARMNNIWNRLHHHAVLVVHSDYKDRIDSLIDPRTHEGVNTIPKEFCSKVLTTYIHQSDPEIIHQASKRLNRYQDFLTFPDMSIR